MISKLILGTVQFGLNYGINNTTGKIDKNQVEELLMTAFDKGIRFLDTAELYGDAHEVIGFFHKKHKELKFKIITKFPHNINSFSVERKVFEYINKLNVNSLEVLMFHSFDSFKSNYKNLDLLNELKLKGYIKNLGVSVYTNDQLKSLIDEDLVTVVQLPFNMLDNVSIRGELLQKLNEKGKLIHTRSAFLQGLFFKNVNDKNLIAQKLKPELQLLRQFTKESNCLMEELALSYCLSQKNIDNVIIGVDSITQLNNNINAASYKIEQETLNRIDSINVEDLELLNPSLW